MYTDFLDNFYGTLFSPRETFDRLKENPSSIQGLLIIVFISALGAIFKFEIFDGTKNMLLLSFSMFISVIGGIVSWLFFAAFLDILASIFRQPGKFKIFLPLSAYALIPWLFLAPVILLKSGGILGAILGIILGLSIWLWVIVLIFTAVMKAYEFSFPRALSVLTIPFLGSIIAFHWIVGFFMTLVQILKV